MTDKSYSEIVHDAIKDTALLYLRHFRAMLDLNTTEELKKYIDKAIKERENEQRQPASPSVR